MTDLTKIPEVKPGYELFLNHTASLLAMSAFLYIQHVGHHFFDRDSLFCERKDFKSILVVYTLGGKGFLSYRGRNYEIGKGQVMIINCTDYHIMRSHPKLGWHYKWVHFYGCSAEAYFNLIYEKYGVVMDFSDDTFITQCIDNMIDLVQTSDMHTEIKASNILNNILTHVFIKCNSTNGKNTLRSRMQAVLDFIKDNYSSEITSSDLVKIACYSKCYLFRVFKAITGYHPYEYIIKYRISKAKDLLNVSSMSVDEIAHITGFESTSNFICTFKKIEGMTPLKFRKAQVY